MADDAPEKNPPPADTGSSGGDGGGEKSYSSPETELKERGRENEQKVEKEANEALQRDLHSTGTDGLKEMSAEAKGKHNQRTADSVDSYSKATNGRDFNADWKSGQIEVPQMAQSLRLTDTPPQTFAAPPAGDAPSTPRPTDTPAATDRTAAPGDRPNEINMHPDRTEAISQYRDTLVRSGMSEADAQKLADQTMTRLEANREKNVGSPEEQMARANKAMRDTLEGRRENDPLTRADRANMVQDMAHRLADPDKFVNQGKHMTCALQSMQKQMLESGDPAKVMEQMASVVNNGYADVTQQDGTTRRVEVDSRSLRPDRESEQPFDVARHGDGGQRGMAGHVWDALSGQTAADLQAEREGQPKGTYTYFAANVGDATGGNRQTGTGEGLVRNNADGTKTLVADNPNVGIWAVAHLNKAMGGNDGAVFAHRGLIGGDGTNPPAGYPRDLKITSFNDSNDLRQKLSDYQSRTGQSAQIGVNAPFLPGGGEDGHGLHAMNLKLNQDGSFNFDNNWGSRHDLKTVNADQVDKATNPDRWNPHRSDGTNPGPRPDSDSKFRPGSGRNPNETPDDAKRRQEQDKKEDEEKAKKDKELLEKSRKEQLQQEDHDRAMSRWKSEKDAFESNPENKGKSFDRPMPQIIH